MKINLAEYSNPKILLQIGLLTCLYLFGAFIGLKLDPVNGFAALVWLPTGISISALYIFGLKLWPGVFLGAFLANYLFGAPLVSALGIGIGNTIEPLLATYLLKKNRFDTSLTKLRDISVLLVFAGIISTFVSAIVGSLSLLITQTIPQNNYSSFLLNWWIGDLMGVITVVPFALSWFDKKDTLIVEPDHKQELALWLALFLFTCLITFFGKYSEEVRSLFLPYLVLPSIIWVTLRFNNKIKSFTILALAIFSVWGTTMGRGLFNQGDLSDNLFGLQFYVGVLGLSIYLFGAEVYSRREAEKEILMLNEKLKETIKEEKRLNRLMIEQIRKQTPKVKTSRDADVEIEVN